MNAQERESGGEADAAERAAEQQRESGPPTTAGTGPGGASTGLGHAEGYPVSAPEGAGPAVGRILSTTGAGSSGTGAGGLASGRGSDGGARNLAHGAGQPAYGTTNSEMLDGEEMTTLDVDDVTTLGGSTAATTQGSATT